MKCPYCNNDAIIDEKALLYMEEKATSLKVITKCCGKLVVAIPTFCIECYETDQNNLDGLATDPYVHENLYFIKK